jgi:glycosyltransferase involved in cell wall biosynthesis
VITKANWGGAQRYVYDLATSLSYQDFEVEVAFGTSGRLASELSKKDIVTHAIASMQRDVSLYADAQSFFELRKLFKAQKPDIVHLNSSKAAGLGALAARICGVPKIIFTAHGWPFWEKRSYIARAGIWILSWVTALLAHKIIVISNYDLRVAQKMPFVRHKLVRIYNGIDTKEVFSSGQIIRAAFPPGAKIIGTIGELNKNKNQVALLERAKNNPEMYVAIVGEGENRAMLEEKIKTYNLSTRVKLFGFLPAYEVLRGFDVFALPSIKEGLPYVLLEARRAGLPIEANRVGGVGEIIDAKDMSDFSLEKMIKETLAVYSSYEH